WKFASLAHEIAVFRDGSLEYLERYRIEPSDRVVSRMWAAGDASFLGTTLVTGRQIDPGVAERLHLELGSLPGLRAAADRLDDRVLLVRLLSASGPPFHEGRRRIGDFSTQGASHDEAGPQAQARDRRWKQPPRILQP